MMMGHGSFPATLTLRTNFVLHRSRRSLGFILSSCVGQPRSPWGIHPMGVSMRPATLGVVVKKNILLIGLFVFMSIGCASHSFPPIDNPDQLANDCDALLGGAAIDAVHWPVSIRSLNPVSLDRGVNYIMITTFAQTGAGARGYVISRQKNLQITHYIITASQYPDIYRFELVP